LLKFGYYACGVSTTRMMILGLVRGLQPVHGYDVRRELLSWRADEWANVAPGSIYHALRKLTEEGALEEVATEQVGARPARTTYRVTPKGDREFQELLRRYWWEPQVAVDPFLAALSFLPDLPRREAVAALRNRARLLEAQLAGTRGELDPEIAATWLADKPVHVAWMFQLGYARATAEAEWCRRIADRIEAGEGAHAGETDEEERTRAWRARVTGEEPSSNNQA
jgi:DNA-binding PadR family transcriptional regulator